MNVFRLLAVCSLSFAVSCSGGSDGPDAPPPVGRPVSSGPFETYITQHNGFQRVRTDRSQPADAAVLAKFENADPRDPAGYRNLISLAEENYDGKVSIEVIAQIDAINGTPTRLLRLTADQAPFENLRNGALVTTGGRYYFKGESFSWVTIDNGPLLSGRHDQGLENLILDFDRGTADIDIRTQVSDGSQVEIGLRANGLPFDVVTGAFGGGATIRVRNPDVTETYRIPGHLRGNVGGSPTYRDGQHRMTASGLYTARGQDSGHLVTVDGGFVGRDPNARP